MDLSACSVLKSSDNTDMDVNKGILKRIILINFQTYSVDEQVPDSAGTATAFLCGVKAQSGVLGLDDTATYKNCSSSIGAEVDSILRMSKQKGA